MFPLAIRFAERQSNSAPQQQRTAIYHLSCWRRHNSRRWFLTELADRSLSLLRGRLVSAGCRWGAFYVDSFFGGFLSVSGTKHIYSHLSWNAGLRSR